MKLLRSYGLAGILLAASVAAAGEDSPHAAKDQMPISEPRNALKEHAGHLSDPNMQMEMGSMQGGRAPPDARDPNAYSDRYTYTDMPGFEQSDRIRFGTLRADEFEGLSGNQGGGFAWSAQASYGDDHNKLWVRSQGLEDSGAWDPTTDAEILWWHPLTAFWGTQLGARQDFGAGSHTYLAGGVQGITPYWLDMEATAYLGEDGRLAARLKGTYDILFTNRLILAASLETNLYSRSENERQLGSGLGNIEAGLRLRYEFTRKFAPYIGYVIERSFSGTADRRRVQGEPVTEHRLVAGIRLWR